MAKERHDKNIPNEAIFAKTSVKRNTAEFPLDTIIREHTPHECKETGPSRAR